MGVAKAKNSKLLTLGLVLAVASISGGVLVACGDQSDAVFATEAIGHVHGLGIDPADDALFIATHEGLFRAPEGATSAERVGASSQDTMGFTVSGPGRFLGSGHPGPGEDGPASLGLIESDDAGLSWRAVSLTGAADLHVLRSSAGSIYAADALSGKLLVSTDGGTTWAARRPPAPIVDLAVDPSDPRGIVVSTEAGLARSRDAGQTWQPLDGDVGLLVWPDPQALYLVDAEGRVHVSEEGGGGWSDLGDIGGPPAALAAGSAEVVYAASADGTVIESSDGGVSWEIRSSQ